MTQIINELKSYTEYNVSTPTSVFTIGFQYEYNVDQVNVYVDDVEATAVGYIVQHDSQGTVTLTPAVPTGVVRIYRETGIDSSAHTFSAGAKFTAGNMDENFQQIRHSQQEVRDSFFKLKDDIGFTNLEQTIQAVNNVATVVNTTATQVQRDKDTAVAAASAAADAAGTADAANTAAQQVLVDVGTATYDVYAALNTQQINVNNALTAQQTAVNNSLTAIAGGHKAYQTLAAAQADQSNLPVNTVVEVTNDSTSANNGTYQWNGTTLTKSVYDPLTQAKNYTDANFPKNRTDVVAGTDIILLQTAGDYLIAPNTTLVNAPDGRTLVREAILTVSNVGTTNRYRKQEYSESVTGKRWFQIIDTLNNIVRRAWTDVSLAGQAEIVSSLSYREICRVVSARTATASAYTQEAQDSGLFKGLVQGEIVYDSVNRKVHTPSSLIVYDALGTMYTVSTAQSVGTTETDFGTHNMFMLYLDKTTLTFYLLSYRTTLTDTQKANYILCAVIRHDTDRLTVTSDAIFRIDYAQYGEIISKQYCDVFAGGTRTIGNLPNYSSSDHKLTLFSDTGLKFGNITLIYNQNKVINCYDPTEASTAIIIYWNLVTDELVVKKYNTNLTVYERFRLVKLATIKDGAMLGSVASGYDVVSIAINSTYSIDGTNPFQPRTPPPTHSVIKYVMPEETVRCINHGGFKDVAPPNSLSGYTQSKIHGYRYVECDVRFTKDGVPILMHDATVDRTTTGTGAVRDLNLSQIKALTIKDYVEYPDEKVPTLEEFLRHCFKLNLHPYMEWSETEVEPTSTDALTIATLIRRTGMLGRCSLISMRNNKLAAVLQYIPTLRVGCTTSSEPTAARIASYLSELNAVSKGQNEIFYNCNYTVLTQELVNNCHDAGIGCECWTVNDANVVPTLASWGVTGIATDRLNVRQILDA